MQSSTTPHAQFAMTAAQRHRKLVIFCTLLITVTINAVPIYHFINSYKAFLYNRLVVVSIVARFLYPPSSPQPLSTHSLPPWRRGASFSLHQLIHFITLIAEIHHRIGRKHCKSLASILNLINCYTTIMIMIIIGFVSIAIVS